MKKFIIFGLIALFSIFSLGVDDAFAANANLFVSAENSANDNYMSGPQVIEVVVIDSDINDTDEAKGEPDVTVNGKVLRMTQAVDGNWYGYFADFTQAQIADQISNIDGPDGEGLDFGTFCASSTSTLLGEIPVSVADTEGIAVNSGTLGIEGTNPPTDPILSACVVPASTGPAFADWPDDDSMNVLRNTKDINTNSPIKNGQIGLDAEAWPFIQLYKLSVGGNVVVQYNKGGGAQTSTLTFDTVEGFANLELDKLGYDNGENVLVTITDLWLNIDPTDEDSWTFSTDDGFPHYQVFDENGNAVGDTLSNTDSDVGDFLEDLMCNDNCKLLLNPNVNGAPVDVITIQDNDDSQIITVFEGDPQDPLDQETAAGFFLGQVPVTVTELGPNSGTFGSFDESNISNIVITDDAVFETTASIDYNETPVTILARAVDRLVIIEEGASSINCPPNCLDPQSIIILPGEEVTWANEDIATHTIVSGTPGGGPDGLFDSGFMMTGDLFSHVFPSIGVFPYYDIIHPWVVGDVTVADLTVPPDADIVIALDGHNVTCDDFDNCFVPSSLMIELGTEVIWFNSDEIDHSVVSGNPIDGPDGLFDSDLIQPGQEFSHTFVETGTFAYYDPIHTWATGTITVTPVFPPGVDILIMLDSSTFGCQNIDNCFVPSNFTADFGDTVTWHNDDSAGHAVTSGTPGGGPDGKFDSGLISPGEEFSHQFLEDGIFSYYDSLHPWMVASITVNPQACQVPTTGVWTVSQNCTLMVSSVAPENVIVQDNSLMTIPNGVTLDIDFESFSLTIKSGSGVLIEAGGTIT